MDGGGRPVSCLRVLCVPCLLRTDITLYFLLLPLLSCSQGKWKLLANWIVIGASRICSSLSKMRWKIDLRRSLTVCSQSQSLEPWNGFRRHGLMRLRTSRAGARSTSIPFILVSQNSTGEWAHTRPVNEWMNEWIKMCKLSQNCELGICVYVCGEGSDSWLPVNCTSEEKPVWHLHVCACVCV